MEKCGSDGEVRARLYVACILLVGIYSRAAGQTKMGVCRIPIPEIQAMIACEKSVWLVGLRSVG